MDRRHLEMHYRGFVDLAGLASGHVTVPAPCRLDRDDQADAATPLWNVSSDISGMAKDGRERSASNAFPASVQVCRRLLGKALEYGLS